jgi:hypothetical protein
VRWPQVEKFLPARKPPEPTPIKIAADVNTNFHFPQPSAHPLLSFAKQIESHPAEFTYFSKK